MLVLFVVTPSSTSLPGKAEAALIAVLLGPVYCFHCIPKAAGLTNGEQRVPGSLCPVQHERMSIPQLTPP